MTLDNIQDLEVLRTVAKMHEKESLKLRGQLAKAVAKLHGKDAGLAEQLAFELEKMQRQHAAALKQLFGPKSERGERPDAAATEQAKQTGHGPKEQPRLPVQQAFHQLTDAQAVCDLCSAQMKPWQDQFEESTEVDYVVPQVVLKKHFRQKYRCSCGGCIKTAKGPTKLFPKARYSKNFALNVVLQKYSYHMPLERQTRQLRPLGLDVTTATLWDYLSAMHQLLEPLDERLATHVLSHDIIGVDETTWKLLQSKKKGKSKTWWVWVRRAENAVHYTIDKSRSGEVALRLLGSYCGVVLCDGYAVYTSLAQSNPLLTLANCWTHARRELLQFDKDPRAKRALRVIQRMYRLESKVRGKPPDEIVAWRQRKTRKLLKAFFRWIDSLSIPASARPAQSVEVHSIAREIPDAISQRWPNCARQQ